MGWEDGRTRRFAIDDLIKLDPQGLGNAILP